MNIYEYRRDYIDKIGKLLIDYQNKGYIILDEGNNVIKKIEQRGFSSENFGLCIDSCVYYEYNKEFDNGYYTPLPKLKAMFEDFKIINPKDIIKLKPTL